MKENHKSLNPGVDEEAVALSRYVVADPKICHGKPTYKGTRIMVWQILRALEQGETVDHLVDAWGGRVSREAILDTIRLASERFLDHRGRLKGRVTNRVAA